MARITREDLFMGCAELFAQRSTCLRGQVGAVAVINGRIMATGYNGAPSGHPHCTPETCNDQGPCTNSIHAEANLIAFAAKAGVSLQDATLYCTHLPCLKCAQLIVQSGIKQVIWKNPYHDESGLQLFWKGATPLTVKKYEK